MQVLYVFEVSLIMYRLLLVSHVTYGNDIEQLFDRLYFTDDVAATERASIDMNSGEMKVMKVEENNERKFIWMSLK